jgi:hypothetical protein
VLSAAALTGLAWLPDGTGLGVVLALAFVVGAAAIAGLPPLNGFVSEWLLLQAFLFTPSLPQSFVNMLVPLAAAALVLAAALAGYVMVKFYGVIFLGRPREANLAYAHDAGYFERAALLFLAAGCVLLGVLPVNVIRSSYSPLVMLIVIIAAVLLTIQIVHRFYHGRIRKSAPWDCGYPLQTPRMQDTAEGFGQPIRQVFEPFFRIERELPTPFDAAPRYSMKADDHWWHWLYAPLARGADYAARFVGLIQQGRISVYLTFSFVTLLALLFLIK